MAKVALVTDSTAYIPDALTKEHHITVIPQVLIWGDETFRDGIDIQPEDFYNRLKKSSTLPSTSQATPAAFHKLYSTLLEEGYEVLAVLISSKLSGTISSAVQARENLSGAKIEVFDSNTTSMAMGFMVLEAARAAQQGATMAECLSLLERARESVGVFVAVETLEFLHRGGRIGGGARFLGTALNIKPILELVEGRLEPIERVRTRSKAHARMIELVIEKVGSRTPVHLAGLHANASADAQAAMDKLDGCFQIVEKLIAPVSPVVGTHVGPGTVGLAFMAGM